MHFPYDGTARDLQRKGRGTTLRFSEMPRTVIKKLLTAGGATLAHWRHMMRRILVTAGLMAGLIGATTVPAAAQGWGYAGYDEPWGVGVRVGGVGVGIGAPAYGAYAADYGYAPAPGYAYSAAPCSCGTAASYGYSRSYVRGYRPSYQAAESSYAYDPGYAYTYSYSSRPAYGYESTYAYGDRVGYGWRGSRVAARGEIRQGVRTRDTVRSASVTREPSALRASSRDQTVGVRERSGTGSVRADSAAAMRGSMPRCAAHPRMDAAATLGRLRRTEANCVREPPVAAERPAA